MRSTLGRRVLVATAIGIIVGLGAAFALADGPTPPPGLRPDGTLDVASLPDCIPVGRGDGTDGIAGCVDRDLLYGPPAGGPGRSVAKAAAQSKAGFPVKDASGNVVGRYFPERGFVPDDGYSSG
jgi:hypothetical protein